MQTPSFLAVISSLSPLSLGNVYFSGDNLIRKVTISTGIITTIAGNGESSNAIGSDGDVATSAFLNTPRGVTVDSSGSKTISFFIYSYWNTLF